jgi:hypothetical protein
MTDGHRAAEPEKGLQRMFREARERDTRRSPFSYCVTIEDGLDGFAIHHADCPSAGEAWHSGSTCIGGAARRYSGPSQPWEALG